MPKRMSSSACQVALANGIIPGKVNDKWRSDCPVCGFKDGIVFESHGTFKCDRCGVSGDGELMNRIILRLRDRGR